MTKSKRISDLEKRVLALEKAINPPLFPMEGQNEPQKNEMSYGEVISEWLNGKAHSQMA